MELESLIIGFLGGILFVVLFNLIFIMSMVFGDTSFISVWMLVLIVFTLQTIIVVTAKFEKRL